MTPFPLALQTAFPAGDYMGCARLAARPWWASFTSLHSRGTAMEYIRIRDNTRVVFRDDTCFQVALGLGCSVGVGQFPAIDQGVVAYLAEVDGRWPLSYPDFRAGQVWAREDGSSAVVAYVDVLGQPFCGDRSPMERSYSYLVADPACPSHAPWSPA